MDSCQKFSCFSSLPTELREQIWLCALGPPIGPTFHPYKTGLWHPGHRQASEAAFEQSSNNLIFEFRYDLLDRIEYSPTLAVVSREARSVTQSWLRAQHGTMKNDLGLVFYRAFDSVRDVLWVGTEESEAFLTDEVDRGFEADMIDRIMSAYSWVRRIAVPEELLKTDPDFLVDMWTSLHSTAEVLVVRDGREPHTTVKRGVVVACEVAPLPGAKFVFNEETRKFDFIQEGDVGESVMEVCALVERVTTAKATLLAREHLAQLVIRPAVSTRKW